MACPDGQYFCNEKRKCMPIPKGSKVRKDGELVSEVAPPGFGHTKPDKEKGVKKGGTAAAFKRALDRGDFKGLPGSKTKKEKTADMFKIMWAQKKKGAKPHYKPGTDKKYKKYQEESFNEALSTKDSKKLNKAAVLSYSDDPKDQHRARVRQAEIDFKDLMRQRAKKKKAVSEKVEMEEGSSMIYVGKKGQYHGPRGDHRRDKEGNIVASHYKKKPSPTGEKYGDKSNRPKTPKPADVRKRTKKGETARSALNRAKKYEREKVRVYL